MSIREFFLSQEQVVIEANTHFILSDPNVFFWVEDEAGDLFLFVPGDKSFIPIFLAEAASNEIFFAAPPATTERAESLFFVSTHRTRVRKIPFASLLQEVQKKPEILQEIVHLFDKWTLTLLSSFLSTKKEIKIDSYFQPEESVKAEAGKTISLGRTLVPEEKGESIWLSVQAGSGEVNGDARYTLTQEKERLYPISHTVWITVKEPIEITSRSTKSALLQPGFWSSLHHFHQTIFSIAVERRAQQLEQILQRMQSKKTREKELYHETFYKLGSVLNRKLVVPTTYEGTPLFKACDLVGQALKVKIEAPTSTAASIHEQVREICFASGIYFRKISLPKYWWNEADQPIVGFYGKNHDPVALIKRKTKTYEMVDPAHTTAQKVTEELAENLHPEGYIFYEGFPKKLIRFRDFVKTAFKYNAKDGMIFVLIGIAGGLLNLFQPFAMKELFETLSFGKDLNLLGQLTLGLLLAAFGTGLFSLTKNFAIQRIGGISKNQIESSMWGRILELPASFFRRVTSGDLMNKAMIFESIRSTLFTSSVTLFLDTVYCIFYLALMLTFSGMLTALSLIGIFFAFVIYITCIVIQMKLTSKSFLLGSLIQGKVVQIISGIPKLRVAGAESRFFGMWGDLFSKKKKIDIRIQYTNAIQSLVFRLFPTLMSVALYTIAILIFKNAEAPGAATISIATFLGFTSAFSLFFTSGLEILETLFHLSTSASYWKQGKFILEEPLEKRTERMQTIKLQGTIALDNISFRYDKEGEWILRGVSLIANPGEMIGIVGPSGSGKSTIVRLLLGFETPDQGEVLYDEQSIKDLDIRSIRKQIGVVLQNAGILGGSLYENIVGAGSYTVEEIERALHLSGFDADLEKLPMGLNTILPMGGGTFSGGQRQRLYLARALVSNPKILILDEATSALDNKTQEFVSANLDKIDVTRIVIAHRLSTIKHADRIYVLQDGKMLEAGTFKELVEKGGLFAEMLRRQQV